VGAPGLGAEGPRREQVFSGVWSVHAEACGVATHLDSTVVRRLVLLLPDRMSTIRHRAATTRNKNQITCYLSPLPSRLQHWALSFSLMLPVSECSFKAARCCRFHCPSRISRPDMRPPSATTRQITQRGLDRALECVLNVVCSAPSGFTLGNEPPFREGTPDHPLLKLRYETLLRISRTCSQPGFAASRLHLCRVRISKCSSSYDCNPLVEPYHPACTWTEALCGHCSDLVARPFALKPLRLVLLWRSAGTIHLAVAAL
jgi:hypothetical protein